MQHIHSKSDPSGGPPHDTATKRSIDSLLWAGLARLRRGELVRYTDVKLNNALVMKYVHEIYHEYQIPDPLCAEPHLTSSIIQTPENSRRLSVPPQTTPHSRKSIAGGSSSRIDQLKKSMREELERTAIESYNGISRLEGIRQDQSYDDGEDDHRLEYDSIVENEYSRALPGQHLLQPKDTSLSRRLSVEMSPHYFRLCIVCENMIEQHNLVQHEKHCEGYQTLYSMSAQQIAEYVAAKINRLMQTMMALLGQQDEKFDAQSIGEFLRDVNSPHAENIEASHQGMVRALPSKTLMVLEMSYKLKWLRKVLEQVRQKGLQ